MKKVITLCLFAFAMLLSTESVTAQSNLKEINAQAIKKTESLSKHLSLDSAQKDKVYLAFREYLRYKTVLDEGGTTRNKLTTKKIKSNLESTIKDILSEEQFNRYQSIVEQEN